MAAGIKASADGLYGTLQVNSADVVTFNSSGNVGIGTLAPTAPLHVNSASNPQIKFGGSSAAYYWALDREDSAGDFAISNANGGAETERMRIDSSGNVGVGKTPTTKLDVNGTVAATTFSGAGTSLTGTAASLSIGGSAATVTTVTTSQVMSAIAGHALNDVGSYAFARKVTNANPLTAGNTVAGTDLRYSDTANNAAGPVINVGTWRCLGHQGFGDRTVLWLRLS